MVVTNKLSKVLQAAFILLVFLGMSTASNSQAKEKEVKLTNAQKLKTAESRISAATRGLNFATSFVNKISNKTTLKKAYDELNRVLETVPKAQADLEKAEVLLTEIMNEKPADKVNQSQAKKMLEQIAEVKFKLGGVYDLGQDKINAYYDAGGSCASCTHKPESLDEKFAGLKDVFEKLATSSPDVQSSGDTELDQIVSELRVQIAEQAQDYVEGDAKKADDAREFIQRRVERAIERAKDKKVASASSEDFATRMYGTAADAWNTTLFVGAKLGVLTKAYLDALMLTSPSTDTAMTAQFIKKCADSIKDTLGKEAAATCEKMTKENGRDSEHFKVLLENERAVLVDTMYRAGGAKEIEVDVDGVKIQMFDTSDLDLSKIPLDLIGRINKIMPKHKIPAVTDDNGKVIEPAREIAFFDYQVQLNKLLKRHEQAIHRMNKAINQRGRKDSMSGTSEWRDALGIFMGGPLGGIFLGLSSKKTKELSPGEIELIGASKELGAIRRAALSLGADNNQIKALRAVEKDVLSAGGEKLSRDISAIKWAAVGTATAPFIPVSMFVAEAAAGAGGGGLAAGAGSAAALKTANGFAILAGLPIAVSTLKASKDAILNRHYYGADYTAENAYNDIVGSAAQSLPVSLGMVSTGGLLRMAPQGLQTGAFVGFTGIGITHVGREGVKSWQAYKAGDNETAARESLNAVIDAAAMSIAVPSLARLYRANNPSAPTTTPVLSRQTGAGGQTVRLDNEHVMENADSAASRLGTRSKTIGSAEAGSTTVRHIVHRPQNGADAAEIPSVTNKYKLYGTHNDTVKEVGIFGNAHNRARALEKIYEYEFGKGQSPWRNGLKQQGLTAQQRVHEANVKLLSKRGPDAQLTPAELLKSIRQLREAGLTDAAAELSVRTGLSGPESARTRDLMRAWRNQSNNNSDSTASERSVPQSLSGFRVSEEAASLVYRRIPAVSPAVAPATNNTAQAVALTEKKVDEIIKNNLRVITSSAPTLSSADLENEGRRLAEAYNAGKPKDRHISPEEALAMQYQTHREENSSVSKEWKKEFPLSEKEIDSILIIPAAKNRIREAAEKLSRIRNMSDKELAERIKEAVRVCSK